MLQHASGCPAGLIMGGWAGEGGGPINAGGVMCMECAKWVEPRHLSQFVERNQIHRQPSLKWVFFNGDGTWSRNRDLCPFACHLKASLFATTQATTRGSRCGAGGMGAATPFVPFPSHCCIVLLPAAAGDTVPLCCRARCTLLYKFVGGACSISDRDAETIRRIFSIFRAFQPAVSSCDYAPFTPVAGPAGKGLKATLFPTQGMVLWTVVNDADPAGGAGGAGPLQSYNISLKHALQYLLAGTRYYDVWRGREIAPVAGELFVDGQRDEYGAVVAVSAEIAESAAFVGLLAKMSTLSNRTVMSYSELPQLPFNFSFDTYSNSLTARHTPAAAAVHVPEAKDFLFQTQALLGEPYLFPQYFGQPAQVNAGNVKKTAGAVLNEARVAIGAFELDKYPVTNEEYAAFLKETAYAPADPINFLKHWHRSPSAGDDSASERGVPAGLEKQPVIWVGLEDAQRYCGHYGRRLPNEWEWSIAMAGSGTAQRWPWGNASREECMPPPYTGREETWPLPDVDAFDSRGCGSPFGAQMLVGTVWQVSSKALSFYLRLCLSLRSVCPAVDELSLRRTHVYGHAQGRVHLLAPAGKREQHSTEEKARRLQQRRPKLL